jgi:hypothetical protein
MAWMPDDIPRSAGGYIPTYIPPYPHIPCIRKEGRKVMNEERKEGRKGREGKGREGKEGKEGRKEGRRGTLDTLTPFIPRDPFIITTNPYTPISCSPSLLS